MAAMLAKSDEAVKNMALVSHMLITFDVFEPQKRFFVHRGVFVWLTAKNGLDIVGWYRIQNGCVWLYRAK